MDPLLGKAARTCRGHRNGDFACNYGAGSKLRIDAYGHVLYNCIQGNQTLFVKTDEVTAAWEYITSILNNWADTELHKYGQGSEGPEISLG